MAKTYVLDTSVLLNDADAMFKFEDNNVVIPITVLEELDNHKKDQNEVGRNARQVARTLDKLRELGRLDEGVVLETGGTLQVALTLSRTLLRLPYDLADNVPDNRILSVAVDCGGILVSRDINLRLKADAVGIKAEDYLSDKVVSTEGLYTGTGEEVVSSSEIDALYSRGYIVLEGVEAYPNQCFILRSDGNDKHSAVVRYSGVTKEFVLLPQDLKTMDIQPRNAEQQFALSLLLDPEITLITLAGKAGSGKGIVSLAAALKQVLDDKIYTKIVIARPIVSLNNSHQLGFAPGGIDEKLGHWLKPFYENINFILGNRSKATKICKAGKKKKYVEAYDNECEKEAGRIPFVDELKEFDLLELCSLEHIKGRTFHNQLVIITEAQNCTLADIKTIVTRIGEGSKLIIEGDVAQTDAPYLDSHNNGLTHVAEKFKPYNMSAHITLNKSERSALAELAANIL